MARVNLIRTVVFLVFSFLGVRKGVTVPIGTTAFVTGPRTTFIMSTTTSTTSSPTTVPALTTVNPTTGHPTTGHPTTGHPTTGHPTTSNPTTGHPTTGHPTTGHPTTGHPTTSNPTTGNPTTGPKFSNLQKTYPTYDKYPRDGKKLKEDMGLPDQLYEKGVPQTCAIRMSKAFHDAGLGIDRRRVKPKECETKSAGVNGKGKQYIIRALFFKCYLKAIWGKPDCTNIKNKDRIKGKKGILIFSECTGFVEGAGQHIDLWDGTKCSMGCDYFNKCKSVEMYILT